MVILKRRRARCPGLGIQESVQVRQCSEGMALPGAGVLQRGPPGGLHPIAPQAQYINLVWKTLVV